MSDPLTPEEERENIIRVLSLGAAGYGASLGGNVCAQIVELLKAPCAEAIHAAKLQVYETFMRELAEEAELVSHDLYDTVIKIERTTYDSLQRYRQ